MNKEERIKYLEDCLFNIDMIDRWTERDKNLYEQFSKELRKLKKDSDLNDT